jgi:hypothetical protein
VVGQLSASSTSYIRSDIRDSDRTLVLRCCCWKLVRPATDGWNLVRPYTAMLPHTLTPTLLLLNRVCCAGWRPIPTAAGTPASSSSAYVTCSARVSSCSLTRCCCAGSCTAAAKPCCARCHWPAIGSPNGQCFPVCNTIHLNCDNVQGGGRPQRQQGQLHPHIHFALGPPQLLHRLLQCCTDF